MMMMLMMIMMVIIAIIINASLYSTYEDILMQVLILQS